MMVIQSKKTFVSTAVLSTVSFTTTSCEALRIDPGSSATGRMDSGCSSTTCENPAAGRTETGKTDPKTEFQVGVVDNIFNKAQEGNMLEAIKKYKELSEEGELNDEREKIDKVLSVMITKYFERLEKQIKKQLGRVRKADTRKRGLAKSIFGGLCNGVVIGAVAKPLKKLTYFKPMKTWNAVRNNLWKGIVGCWNHPCRGIAAKEMPTTYQDWTENWTDNDKLTKSLEPVFKNWEHKDTTPQQLLSLTEWRKVSAFFKVALSLVNILAGLQGLTHVSAVCTVINILLIVCRSKTSEEAILYALYKEMDEMKKLCNDKWANSYNSFKKNLNKNSNFTGSYNSFKKDQGKKENLKNSEEQQQQKRKKREKVLACVERIEESNAFLVVVSLLAIVFTVFFYNDVATEITETLGRWFAGDVYQRRNLFGVIVAVFAFFWLLVNFIFSLAGAETPYSKLCGIDRKSVV